MAITDRQINRPIVILRTDKINVNLLFLLETRCTVIVSKKDNEILLELYKK